MIFQEMYRMYNGVDIPKVGLGTWQTPDGVAVEAVKTAISVGYRHIDTAAAYGNESGVGRGIRESGIRRDEIFVTSKVPAEVKTYDSAKQSIEQSLKRLGLGFIDLMLIHAPRPWDKMGKDHVGNYFEENLAVWKALEEAHRDGKIRAIGVSNFDIRDLKNIMDNAEILPAVNQICVHIGNVPAEVMQFCRTNGILVEAYSPNATGRLARNQKVTAMAEKYNVSVARLGCRFDLQLGTIPLPKSTHAEYIKENTRLDFQIAEEDMQELLK